MNLILMAESLTFLWNIRTKVRVRGDYVDVVTGSAEELEIIRMAQLQAAQYQIFVLWFREGPLNQVQPQQYFHCIKYLNRCQIGSSIKHDTLLYNSHFKEWFI